MNYPFDCITRLIFVENEPPAKPCEVLLIPGGSHPQLMEKAAELYKNGLARYILVSGHYNPKIPDYPSEAAFLKSLALAEGVPSEAVICEEKAANTYENALFSYEEMQSRGLDVHQVILVCKAYHSRRALFTYQKVFPSRTQFYVETVADKRNITRENWYKNEETIKIVMGEVEKMGKYFTDDILPMYIKSEKNVV